MMAIQHTVFIPSSALDASAIVLKRCLMWGNIFILSEEKLIINRIKRFLGGDWVYVGKYSGSMDE